MDVPPEQDPLGVPAIQYIVALGISLAGGLVRWIGLVKNGEIPAYAIMGLIGELATSAFAGVIAFWLCEWWKTPQFLTYPLVGMAGHMGVRAIAAMETALAKRFGIKE